MKKIVILGAGGHAKVVADAALTDYDVIGFIDKDDLRLNEKVLGYSILGNDNDPEYWKKQGIESCVVGIGNMGDFETRNKLFEYYYNAGFTLETVIHEKASVSKFASIGEGTVVLANAVINAEAKIGDNCIINSSAVVEHDVQIGFGVHIGPGAIVTGGCMIGDNSFVGASSVVINNVKIGKNVIIGAGSVVMKDVPDNVVVVGNPGRIIKQRR